MTPGQHHILGLLFTLAYLVGSPAVSPMLPPMIERAFANLHRDLNELGAKAYGSTAAAASQIGEFIAPGARAAAVSAPVER